MRLKLDENMPRPLAETLRGAGHDVHTVADEHLLGKPDVLRPRDANQAMIMTLALRALALATDIDMKNRVAIFEDERIRIRPPLALITPQERP